MNLANPRISDYIQTHFEVLQLDLFGSRKVTDFDGAELSEKATGREIWRALYADLAVLPGASRTRSRRWNPPNARWRALPGYVRPGDFLAMFHYVREKAYESKESPRLRQSAAELISTGGLGGG